MADATANVEGSYGQSIIGVPAWGGPGGEYFETPSYNYWGTDNRCGSYVDQLNLYYDYGPWTGVAGPYGGSGGNPEGVKYCQSTDEYFIGVYGRYTPNQVVDQLGFICGTLDRSRPTYDLPTCGSSPGSHSFRLTCASGQIVTKVGGRAGLWVDQIQFACSYPVPFIP